MKNSIPEWWPEDVSREEMKLRWLTWCRWCATEGADPRIQPPEPTAEYPEEPEFAETESGDSYAWRGNE